MATANRRVPLSCEPCRERKIRCHRNSPGICRTCDTCLRRGIPSEECIFLRDLPRSQRPINRRPPRTSNVNASQMTESQQLYARIEKLESYLKASNPGALEDGTSTPGVSHEYHPSTLPPTISPSPSMPNTDGQGRRSTSAGATSHQKIYKSVSGHERYEPFPSVFPPHFDGEIDEDAEIPRLGRSDSRRQFPFTATTSSVGELLSPLPPLRHCDALKDLYVRVFGSLFHVLHDPTFENDYAKFRANPQNVSLSWLALLYSVLAVAVTAMDETDDVLQDLGKHATPLDNLVHLSFTYRAAAMRCLDADQYLWQHNIQTLQTLILLIYGISHSHGPSWALLGVARNIAQSLGCHLDPDDFNMNIVEAEQRRRCWSALTMLYTVQNVTLGSLDSSPLPRNVKLPMDLNDDELETASRRPGPTQMTYLLFKFRLYDLFSRISKTLGYHAAPPSYEDLTNLDAEITVQQDLWSAKYLADTRERSLPDYHAAHLQILSGYSHQLCLLLHKPVIAQQRSPEAADGCWYSPAQVARSRDRCLESARSLLDIHSFLHESPEMRPYQWYNRGLGSFHAFHAVATIVFIRETCPAMPVHETVQIVQDLKCAVAVFRSISETGMSLICRKALPVVQQFRKRIDSLKPTLDHHPQPAPEHTFGIDNGLVSPESQGRDQPERIGFPEDYTGYADGMVANLQASHWLSPSMITWDVWDNLMESV